MQVDVIYRNDPERGLTDPVPELGGRKFIFRILKGDWLDPYWPLFGNSWFNPPFPTKVLHIKLPFAFFVAWKWPFVNKGGYVGWKVYGVDHEVYKTWLTSEENIYDGSQALCLSFRPFATIK
jgi:hypothetical protein